MGMWRFALLFAALPFPALAEPTPIAPRSATSGAETLITAEGASVTKADTSTLRAWIAAFRPRALAAGITPATLDRAFQDVGYRGGEFFREKESGHEPFEIEIAAMAAGDVVDMPCRVMEGDDFGQRFH